MDALHILIYRRLRNRRQRLQIMEERRALRINQRRLRDISNPFDLPEKNFQGRFRLSRDLARELTNELRPLMRQEQRITAVPVELRVLCALSFFGQGSYQKSVGADAVANLSQSSVSVSIEEVVSALNSPGILGRHIHFPQTPAMRRSTILKNYQRYPYIPGVLGCVDGTHFPILAPVEHEELYVNRKQYHSLNVQICSDADYCILNILARYPGSSHDSFIWANSALKRRMETIHTGGEQCWLLGDSGYPHEPWLHTPILHAAEGTRAANYTKAHMITRSSVERTIGHLKSRFRCLNKHRTLHYAPEKACRIINSCAVLHNKCVRANIPDLDDSASDSEEEEGAEEEAVPQVIPQARVLQDARNQRDRLVLRTAVVPPGARPEGARQHRRGEPPVRPRGPRRP